MEQSHLCPKCNEVLMFPVAKQSNFVSCYPENSILTNKQKEIIDDLVQKLNKQVELVFYYCIYCGNRQVFIPEEKKRKEIVIWLNNEIEKEKETIESSEL